MAGRRRRDAVQTLGVLLVVAVLFGVVMVGQYRNLQTRVARSCADAQAAAKLDLSTLMPICGEGKP
jgi:hypothetical protein